MKTVHNFNDLEQFGIKCLTGEACAYSMRVLCDVNHEGAQLLANYLGVTSAAFQGPWNSQVSGKPAVGSVMLPRTILKHLAQFAFFTQGAAAVIVDNGSVTPLNADLLERYDALAKDPLIVFARTIVRNPAGTDSRNTHAFTGRTV